MSEENMKKRLNIPLNLGPIETVEYMIKHTIEDENVRNEAIEVLNYMNEKEGKPPYVPNVQK